MRRRKRTLFIVTYLAPAALLYGVFLLYPLAQSFVIAFYKWSGLSDKREFRGLQNFDKLIHDQNYHKALANNAWMLLVALIALMTLGIGVAHLLQKKDRLSGVMRGLFLFPHVMSVVAAAILWYYIYSPVGGLLNAAIDIGRPGQTQSGTAWLGQSTTALPAVTVAFVWWALGFYVMLFTAGLRNIGSEVNEAAELDGAHGWRRFTKVTWPLLWSVKRVAVIYIVINVVNTFGIVNLMTNGGNPDRATEVLLTYLYEVGVQASNYGYGTAIAVTTFLMVLATTGIVMLVFRKDPSEARA